MIDVDLLAPYLIFSSVKKLQHHHQMVSEVRHTRETVKEVKDSSEKFQFLSSGQRLISKKATDLALHDPRRCYLSIEEVELVYVESPRDELKSLLVSGTPQKKVIAVVGLGEVVKSRELRCYHISSKSFDFEGIPRHVSISNRRTYNLKGNSKPRIRSKMYFNGMELQQSTVDAIFAKCISILEVQSMSSPPLHGKLEKLLQWISKPCKTGLFKNDG